MSIRSETLIQHKHRIAQIPDFIAEKFRGEGDGEVELTPAEQRIASCYIARATATIREIHGDERRAMEYVKGCRRELWIASKPDDDDC